MITTLIACVAGGLIAGVYTPLLSPLVYLSSRFRKNLFLLLFSLYSLALTYELGMATVYSTALAFPIFTVLLPSLLLLDEGLKGWGRAGYPLIPLLLLGFLFRELFALAVLIAFLLHFSSDRPGRGVYVALAGASLLFLGLALGRGALDLPGGVSAQVAFIAGAAVLSALPLYWRSLAGR